MGSHELPHPPPRLDEMARLPKPGGAVLLHDCVRWPLSACAAGEDLDPDRLQHFREHCLFTPDDLACRAERAGLVVTELVLRRGGGSPQWWPGSQRLETRSLAGAGSDPAAAVSALASMSDNCDAEGDADLETGLAALRGPQAESVMMIQGAKMS